MLSVKVKKYISAKRVSYFYGIYSEIVAVIYLSFKGYVIIHRRFKTYVGEIDLIATRGNEVCFIEVKARTKKENLDEIITTKQIKRIKNAGKFYIAKHPKFANFNISFDLVKIFGMFIESHHKNYF